MGMNEFVRKRPGEQHGANDLAQGKFCARGDCSVKLNRREDESIEEFEVRTLCGRCEAEAASSHSSPTKAATAHAGPKRLQFGGKRD